MQLGRGKPLALVVDDSDISLSLMVDALIDTGFDTLTAISAIGLRARVLRERPDLLILDVNLPPINGPEAVRLIREMPIGRNLPILLVSSMDAGGLRKISEACGANLWAVKTDAAAVAARASTLATNWKLKAPR